eukprot:366492-Chlamydomonas_euryale.AAC.2
MLRSWPGRAWAWVPHPRERERSRHAAPMDLCCCRARQYALRKQWHAMLELRISHYTAIPALHRTPHRRSKISAAPSILSPRSPIGSSSADIAPKVVPQLGTFYGTMPFLHAHRSGSMCACMHGAGCHSVSQSVN